MVWRKSYRLLIWQREIKLFSFKFTVICLLYILVKSFYSLPPIFRGFYKLHWSMDSWIHGFEHYRQQSMGKLYFVGFLFSWTTKSAKIKTTGLILISQYWESKLQVRDMEYFQIHSLEINSLNNTKTIQYFFI